MVQKKTAMKHLKSMALLAFTILAACAKEEINIPDNPPPTTASEPSVGRYGI
jgi:hypothetical protein